MHRQYSLARIIPAPLLLFHKELQCLYLPELNSTFMHNFYACMLFCIISNDVCLLKQKTPFTYSHLHNFLCLFFSYSILYADIVGFTAISSTYSASELVKILNELFARFDRLSEVSICPLQLQFYCNCKFRNIKRQIHSCYDINFCGLTICIKHR
jgi:hypothetical protein